MKSQHSAAAITPIVHKILTWLRPFCTRVEPAGSFRRNQATVGDVELVAIPEDRHRLYSALDKAVREGMIFQSDYGGKSRWGEKYRGFTYNRVRFELFTATLDTWGYIFWLRTGPGDANQYLVTEMLRRKAPIRFINGEVWRVDYLHPDSSEDGFAPVYQVSVPDEATLFQLLGMGSVIPPSHRSVNTYRVHFPRGPHQWGSDFLIDSLRVGYEQKRLL